MKIIVAYDGSEPSKRALEQLGWFSGATPHVLIVTVLEGMALDADGNPCDPDPADVLMAEAGLASASDYVCSIAQVKVEPRILVGNACKALLKAAQDEGADLLILGSRGLGLGQRILLGSVSTDVVHHAGCPVMVVK